MKKILPLLFVLTGLNATAQIVNIPDVNFKNFLLNHNPQIDTNFDGEIQVSEAAAVNMGLDIPANAYITDLTGIGAFVNINHLSCGGTTLTTFNYTNLPNVQSINIMSSGLTSLDLTGFTGLTQVMLMGNSQLSAINLVGLTNLYSLNCMDNNIASVNLAGLTSLSNVNFDNNKIAGILNISGLPVLNSLHLENNNLTGLSISNCPQLANLYCGNTMQGQPGGNHFTSLDLSNGLGSLFYVYTQQIGLTSLNLTNNSNIQLIDCAQNQFTSLDLTGCTALQYLNCTENILTSLNLSGLANLTDVSCGQNQLTNINILGCTALKYFDFPNNQMTTMDVSGHPALWYLSCYLNQLTSINLNNLPGLQQLVANQNLLTSLDVSSSPLLTHFICNNNQLTYINLKNGPSTPLLSVGGNPNLQYVCADENEIIAVKNDFTQQGFPNVNVNSYCSFTPGGSYNTINGAIRMDGNSNGCDASDPVIPELIVKINDGTNIGYTSSNSLGVYSFYTNAGNYTITPQTTNPYFTISPASASINFATAGGNTQAANFCFTPNGVHNDLDITIIPIGFARPGFDAIYQLVYKNKGTTTLSGNVELIFDDARLDLVNANPAASTQSTNLLNWAYSNLAPFESRTVNIVFHLLPPPNNNLNDTLNLTANITPLAGDEYPRDNEFIMRQVIRGSFDPNEKSCLEGPGILITDVGDYTHYMIRFQNTGTDTAFNVVIKDVLTSKFDWNSFQVTKTSHPFKLHQTAGNNLEFIFEDIKLPDSNVNEPASHGFIAFKIKTIPTLVLGDSIKNNASIYFDFNLPVVTNTATSYIVSDIIVPVSMEYFRGYKQSGNHLLNWKANCTSMKLTFDIERSIDGMNYNSLTSITASNTRCLQPFDFTDNNPVAGINYYRIKMTDIDGKISYSNVIALLNKNAGFEIVNLTPNPVVGGNAFLNITSAEKQMINIRVTDASGKIVQTINETVIPGFTQLQMNFSKLASGIYTIIIHTGDGERKTIRFVKK